MLNDYLDKLLATSSLTPDGAEWLKVALDGFHDYQTSPRGLPDTDTSRTVVECHTESFQVSTPGGTANWDLHVFTLPIEAPTNANSFVYGKEFNAGLMSSTSYSSGSNASAVNSPLRNQDVFIGSTGEPFTSLGPLNIWGFQTSGGLLAPDNSGNFTAPQSVVSSQAPFVGKRRLIAQAFEVTDTTAELYKQGTLYAYKIPQAATDQSDVVAFTDGTNSATNAGILYPVTVVPGGSNTMPRAMVHGAPFQVFNLPPSSPAKAMIYPGSRQWKAADGCYMNVTQDVNRNELKFTEWNHVAFTDGDALPATVPSNGYPSASAGVPTTCIFQPTVGVTTGTSNPDGFNYVTAGTAGPVYQQTLPFHTHGVMLTGLNTNSTFTVTHKRYYELCPDIDDTAGQYLVPISKPSPMYDPLALELYQRAVLELPIAVPVYMNAEGDFWDWCLRALAVAAPVVGGLFSPAAGAVGSAATVALNNMRTKRNKTDAQAATAMAKLNSMDIMSKPSARPRASPKPPNSDEKLVKELNIITNIPKNQRTNKMEQRRITLVKLLMK